MSWWPAALVAGVLAAGYLTILRCRPRSLPTWQPWRTGCWLVGAVLVAAALSPLLGGPAHHDHRYHMAQHLLLGMYAPIGLVLGAPVTLLLGSSPRRVQLLISRVLRTRPVHLLCHPAVAAVLDVGGMFALYLTPLYPLSLASKQLNWLVLVHFVLAGYLYTWSIAGPDPGPRRPGTMIRTGVLIVAAGAHAVLAKLLYADAHQLAGSHGHVEMMQAAAQWMYYGGDGAEILLATMLFTALYRRSSTAGRRPSPRRLELLPGARQQRL
jgi:putative membrane protein